MTTCLVRNNPSHPNDEVKVCVEVMDRLRHTLGNDGMSDSVSDTIEFNKLANTGRAKHYRFISVKYECENVASSTILFITDHNFCMDMRTKII